jgi:hypothetical protein
MGTAGGELGKDGCIITRAINGVAANRDQCSAISYTPEDHAGRGKARLRIGGPRLNVIEGGVVQEGVVIAVIE